jgi:hypothetical protein
MSTPYITDTASESTVNINWALDQFHAKLPAYKIARNYYDGDQRLAFASEKLNSAFGRLFKAFSDNLMPTVVETVKDRLKLDGFTVAGKEEGQTDEAIQPTLDELWRRNRLLVRANQVHLDSLIEGDSYVIVWPNRFDNEFPTFYPNCASAIVIDYDDEQPGYITRAAKAYEAKDKHWRLTLYFRNRIEKYVTQNAVEGLPDRPNAFIRLIDSDPWPIPNPYDKVPVFHFANRASIGQPGCSELRESMPLQDALNKSIADMLVASEFYGVPQRWLTGLEDESVIKQAQERFKLMSGGLWATSDKDAKFGEFSAADISKFITVSETFRKEIARVSRTPLHYFALEGEFPSGESLRVSEGPLIRKVKDRQETWGAVWGDAFRFALQIGNHGDHEPQPKWLNPETRDDDGEVTRAATKVTQLQIPYEQVWREMGYTETQIATFAVERTKRQAEQMELTQAKGGLIPPGKKANGDSEVVQ